MRAPAVSFAKRFFAALMAALLTVALAPASALAEGEGDTADAATEEPQEVSAEQVDEGSGSTSAAPSADGGTLASALVGTPTTFINSDVALDGEPIVGSFTVGGLTFAVTEGANVELVGVSSDRKRVTDSQEGDGSTLVIPESITYNDVDYAVTSIGAYAFYLSGVTSVELPASIAQVDDRAFRSSDIASVETADGNASYSSFDGALYDADQSSLLLIPEGKQGTVLLPMTAESAAPSVFSHCPLVTQIAVEEGSAAFASENGLLYDASLTTLLRVPAGTTDIVIRDGCTTIAAGAMEACASLATITAPASVASISPDVFTSVPTISLPAAAVAADDPGASTGATEGSSEQTDSTPASNSTSTQLTAMVALSSVDDDLPAVDPSAISIHLPESAAWDFWDGQGWRPGRAIEMAPNDDPLIAELQTAATSNSFVGTVTVNGNGGTVTHQLETGQASYGSSFTVNCYGNNWALFGNGAFHYYRYENAPSASILALQTRPGYTFTGWTGSIDLAAGNGSYAGNSSMSFVAQWSPNTIRTTWDCSGGSIDGDSGPFNRYTTYSSSSKLGDAWSFWEEGRLRRAGYAFQGWYTEISGGHQVLADTALPTSETTYYARWKANTITLTWNSNGGSNVANTSKVYASNATVPMPNSNPTRAGYTFAGWYTAASGGSQVTSSTALPTSGTTYYAHWNANTITLAWNSNGGSAVANTMQTYSSNASISLPSSPTKQGYRFKGWFTSTISADQVTNSTALPSSDATYYAQWDPVISADVPSAVTARVDLLGIEEQEQAQAYIESRCGEPLQVTEVAFQPLPGASELFGAGASQVSLEAYAGSAADPVFSLPLHQASYLVDTLAFRAFRMASYGTRVPISYRFAIPDELLPGLVETEKPVCSVAYTVALA